MAGLWLYECDSRFACGDAALTRVVVQVNFGSRNRGSSAADLEFAILMCSNMCIDMRVDISNDVESSEAASTWELTTTANLPSIG